MHSVTIHIIVTKSFTCLCKGAILVTYIRCNDFALDVLNNSFKSFSYVCHIK